MTKLLFVALVCRRLLPGVCFAVGRNGNLEHRQQQTVTIDLNKDWKIYAAEEIKFARHNGNPYLYNVDMRVVYRDLASAATLHFTL